MTSPRSKALANSARRPLKTSKLNPYAMRPLPDTGEVRVAPRLSALKASGLGHSAAISAAEDKAFYASQFPGGPLHGVKIQARGAAADMVRRYRKTKVLSALDRLTELHTKVLQ